MSNLFVNRFISPFTSVALHKIYTASALQAALGVAVVSIVFVSQFVCAEAVAVSEKETAAEQMDKSENEHQSTQSRSAKKKTPAFNIWEFEVRGVKTFTPEEIEVTISPFLGPNKTFSTVESASQALEKLYRDSGYPVVSVEIPEQDIIGGHVKINVIEGKVNQVRVLGSSYFLLSDIKKRVPSLQKGDALYVPQLQKDLNKLNSLSSDLRVVPVLKEGDQPGTVDVDLKVKDKLPMHGEIEYNNYASANTSDTRLSASIGYENLWQKYHSFSLTMQITPEALDEIRVLSGTYILPVGEELSRLAIYGVTSNSKINTFSATDSGLLVRGDSKIAGLRYVQPMTVNAEFQHVLTLGFDYKDVLEEVKFTSDPQKSGLLTPLSFAVWAAEYKATWRSSASTTQIGGGAYVGIRNAFNSSQEFKDKRYHGEPNFIYWKASVQRNTELPAEFSLVNKIKTQISDTPLISNEQFSVGGSTTVRGYFESQSMGDRGALTSIELYSPKLLKNKETIGDLKFLLFVDAAAAEVINPLKDQKNSFELASTGVGLQFSSFGSLHMDLTWAYPLKDSCGGVCGKAVSDVAKGDARTTFQMIYQY